MKRDLITSVRDITAAYKAASQAADPYDINLERQKASDPEKADALFRKYIRQPQHWNHYSYALNNPLRYVDPDGRKDEKYEIKLLGKSITITISEKLDANTRATIKEDINAAVARINQGADNLTTDQIKQINQLKGIAVSPNFGSTGMNKANGVFEMLPAKVVNQPSIDFLAGTILHDTGHIGQSDADPDTKKFINNEKKANCGRDARGPSKAGLVSA